ncbi:MAG: gluconate 2-dehydrogenase subunit 3 family protein [bacterium]
MSGIDHDSPNGAEAKESGGGQVSRRRALQILGAVPAAAAFGLQQPKTPLVPGVTSAAAAQTPAAAPRFFNAHEWKTVHMLADYVLPSDERSGSATDAKVPEYMDFLLAEKDASVNNQIAMRGGLGWLDTECQKRFHKTFIDASDAQRRAVLDDIAFPNKATPEMRYGVTFFNRFRDMTASGFFSSAIGWKDLQYMGNVFNPGYDGCPPAALAKLGVSYDLMQTRIAPEAK